MYISNTLYYKCIYNRDIKLSLALPADDTAFHHKSPRQCHVIRWGN